MRKLAVALLAILMAGYDIALWFSPDFYALAHPVFGGAMFSNWWFGYVCQVIVLAICFAAAVKFDRERREITRIQCSPKPQV